MSRKPLAIVGAGMSGLSLAVALRRLGRRVDVYEAAAEPPRSRTFCGFEVEDHPFTSAVGHRWNDVVVRGPGETHRRPPATARAWRGLGAPLRDQGPRGAAA